MQQVQAKGELREFVRVSQELEDYKEVKSISIQMILLPTVDGNRKFSYLEDRVTHRQYVFATISLFNRNEFKILEVERESRALSTLILCSTVSVNWSQLINQLLIT